MKKPSCLGIITSRGGSKGVKDKAIRKICNLPVIAYTINTALSCSYINDLIVTTDSPKIREISIKYKAKCPFLRPPELATDLAKQEDAIIHALDWYEKNFEQMDYICLLEPTVPLRKIETLEESFKYIFKNRKVNSLFSVCKSSTSPIYLNTLRSDKTLKDFIPKEYLWSNRQELPDFYKLSSLITISKWSSFIENKTFLTDETHYKIVDSVEALDIDEPLDFILADYLISNKINSSEHIKTHVNEILLNIKN